MRGNKSTFYKGEKMNVHNIKMQQFSISLSFLYISNRLKSNNYVDFDAF